MKRTERIAIALTKEEKARIRVESSDLHISMSALIRMRIFVKPTIQMPHTGGYTGETFTVTAKYTRTLPLIPGTSQYREHEYTLNQNAVINELKLKLEERMADEVGIK